MISKAPANALTLDVNSDASWTISCDADWCHLSKGTGSNNETITISVDDNVSMSQRVATITVKTLQNMATCMLTQDAANLPVTAEPTVTQREKNSLYLTSTYTSDFPVIEYGFVYSSTNMSPTINDSKVSENGENLSGNFSGQLTNLKSGVSYYVRAYAKSSVGINYSNYIIATTLGDVPSEGDNPTPQMARGRIK